MPDRWEPRRDLDAALAEVDRRVVVAWNAQPLAGLAVGIVAGADLVYARGLGCAHLEPPRPVTPDTVFRVGSISKTLTAIGLLQLVEQGKVQLDAPVNTYLRVYQVVPPTPATPPPTLRHLLTHTGGIGELRTPRDLFRPVFGLGARPDQPVPSLAAYYAGGLRAEVPPGTKWAYANHAYATLGQVIEDVSGEPFAAYMRRHVLEPLGTTHSDFELTAPLQGALASGYQWHRGRLRPVPYLEIVVRAAGSLFSTVADLGRYVGALLDVRRLAAVLRPETLHLMWEPHYQLDPRLPGMGLAFLLERFDGHRVVGHDGGWPGFTSALLVAPDAGLGVVVLANTAAMTPARLARDLLRHLLGLPEPAARLPRPDVRETPELWPELCGAYGPAPGLNTNARVWAGLGGELAVEPRAGHLVLRSLIGPLWRGAPLYPIDPADPLVLRLVHDGLPLDVVFQRDAAGRVDRLCVGLNAFYKRPFYRSLRALAPAAAGVVGGLTLAATAWRRRHARRRPAS